MSDAGFSCSGSGSFDFGRARFPLALGEEKSESKESAADSAELSC